MTAFGEGRVVTGMPPTIVHFDFKPNNIFFGPDGGVVVIDWQSPSISCGLYDQSFRISATWEALLVETYAAALAEQGVAVPAPAVMFDMYRRNYLRVLAITGRPAGPIFTRRPNASTRQTPHDRNEARHRARLAEPPPRPGAGGARATGRPPRL